MFNIVFRHFKLSYSEETEQDENFGMIFTHFVVVEIN